MSDFATDYTAHAVCPSCGYVDQDPWEIELGGSFGEGSGDVECYSCGEEFRLTRNISITYSSEKMEGGRHE